MRWVPYSTQSMLDACHVCFRMQPTWCVCICAFECVRAGLVAQEVALLCLRDIAAGVTALHENNIIHGDLKTANGATMDPRVMWSHHWLLVCFAFACMHLSK